MSKTNKAIAALSIVASLGVAAAPMSAFADNSYYPNTHQDKLSVTIEEICSFGHDYAGTANDVEPGAHVDGTGLEGETGDQADTPSSGHTAGISYGKWELSDGTTSGENSYTTTMSAYDTQQTNVDHDDDQSTPAINIPSTNPRTGHTTVLTDTAYGIMETNTVNDNFAKTTLAVICNTASGYQIKAAPTDLDDDNTADQTDDDNYIAFAATNAMSGTTTSAWNFKAEDTTTTGTTSTTGMAGSTAGLGGAVEIGKGAYTTAMPTGNVIASNVGATSTSGDRITVTYGVAISPSLAAATYEGTITYTLVQL